jgi:hypothetical protein
MSDNDRPQRRHRALEREMSELCAEHNQFTYGLELNRLEFRWGPHRLERLRKDLKVMDMRTTEEKRLPTWDNWQDEPSDDDSADSN